MLKELKKTLLMVIFALIGWYVVMGFVNNSLHKVVDKQISQSKK